MRNNTSWKYIVNSSFIDCFFNINEKININAELKFTYFILQFCNAITYCFYLLKILYNL